MIARHKGEIPVVLLLLPFLAGISCALYGNSLANKFILPCLIGFSGLFIGFNLAYKPLRIYKARWLGGSLLYPILLLLGWFVTIEHNELNKPDHFSKNTAQHFVAVITSEPKVKDNLVRFTADIRQSINNKQYVSTSGTMLITIKDELAKNLFYGEELIIPVNYSEVDPPFNPGEFNYKQYLATKNVHYQEFLFPGQYKIITAGQANPLIVHALRIRQNLVDKFKDNMHDTTAIAVASTLILGYKADLSNDVLQAYSKTGTIHILSVSGGHVAIIYMLLAWMLSFLDSFRRGKMVKALIIIVLIWAYALLTGFSPAACRAAAMISLVITGKTYNRYINTLNLLAASAFALLLYDPFLLMDLGFQLSYLAVGGLVIFQPLVYKWLVFKNNVADKIWLACSVSIAAQVITFPLSAWYFHQFPIYFLLSNLLITIPIIAAIYCGLLLLVLPQLPYLSKALGYGLEQTILLMNKLLALIEHSPYASIGKIWLSKIEHVLLYSIIILLFYLLYEKRKWLLKTALICTLLLCASISLKKFNADNINSITFLNLRKHTGIVFKTGNRGVVITDLADTDKNFRYSIQPGLDSSRITDYKVYTVDDNISLPYLMKRGNFITFQNKKLLMLNDGHQIQSIPQQLEISYLFITGDAFINNALIKGKINVINADNSSKYIESIKTDLKSTSANYRILRRNKSVSFISN